MRTLSDKDLGHGIRLINNQMRRSAIHSSAAILKFGIAAFFLFLYQGFVEDEGFDSRGCIGDAQNVFAYFFKLFMRRIVVGDRGV